MLVQTAVVRSVGNFLPTICCLELVRNKLPTVCHLEMVYNAPSRRVPHSPGWLLDGFAFSHLAFTHTTAGWRA